MSKTEQKLIGTRPGSGGAPEAAPAWTWRIGNGRVTVAELASWQLGPDLTPRESEDHTTST